MNETAPPRPSGPRPATSPPAERAFRMGPSARLPAGAAVLLTALVALGSAGPENPGVPGRAEAAPPPAAAAPAPAPATSGPAAAPPEAAAEAPPADPTLSRAVELGARLAKEIEKRTQTREARLEATRKRRDAINLLNRADAMPAAEKRDADFLRSEAGSVDRSLGAMDQTIEAARKERQEAQTRVGLVAPLALHAVQNSGPGGSSAMIFGVLMDHERRRAQAAVERELKIEMMRGDRLERKTTLEREAESRGQNMKLTPAQVRRRRDELMGEIQKFGRLAAADALEIDALEDARGQVELSVAAVQNSRLPIARERLNAVMDQAERTLSGDAADPRPTAKDKPGKAPHSTAAQKTAPAGGAQSGAGLDEIPYEAQTEISIGGPPGATPSAAEIRIATEADAPNREVFWPTKQTPAHALAAGAVIFSGAFAEYRHILIVDHGGGWASVYGNMSFCDLVEGDNVKANQKLGEFAPAGDGEEPIPFWVEARLQGRPQPIAHWPAAGSSWRTRLLGGEASSAGAAAGVPSGAAPAAAAPPAPASNSKPGPEPTPEAAPKKRGKKP